MIDPHASTIVSPAVTLTARRSAALAGERRFALNVALAVMPSAIVRGAGELQCLVAALPIAAIAVSVMTAFRVAIAIMFAVGGFGFHDEVCATAPVHPNPIWVESPRWRL